MTESVIGRFRGVTDDCFEFELPILIQQRREEEGGKKEGN